MAKYKVLERFRDIETEELHEVGKVVEYTVKRASEIQNNLKEFGISFLERIEETKGKE